MSLRAAPAIVAPQLRALADAISGYAVQLIALGRDDPGTSDAVVLALAPIDDFRAAARRRVVAHDDDEDDAEELPVANAPPELRLRLTGSS